MTDQHTHPHLKPAARLSLRDVSRIYPQPEPAGDLIVFKDISLDIQAGERVALIGPSGIGKSSLLHICGLLEKPTSGHIFIDGTDCSHLSDRQMSDIRLQKIGFIYQRHHLSPDLSVLENVMIPMLIAGRPKRQAAEKAYDLLEQVELAEKGGNRTGTLSGGQRQRVAFARALILTPSLLLADEPTGNLDEETAQGVIEMIFEACQKYKTAILMATHNRDIAASMDRTLTLSAHSLQEKSQK